MAYVARIRGVELICETLDDFDAVVERYGSEAAPHAGEHHVKGKGHHGGSSDTALLRALVQEDQSGVSSQKIGGMLGTRGKGVPPALRRWAVKVGLSQSESSSPFEAARPDGGRGWKLSAGAMEIAKVLLEGHGK